ncbi:MAG TPA: AI-2E family transporter, partial [Clostridia bacterium]|nr:AI-2E family transporter [Clostridia bacterium]
MNSRKRRWLLIVGLALLGLLLWVAANVLLLFFSSVLVALFLRGLASWLSRHTRLSPGWSLASVVIGLIVLFSLTGWLLAPRMGQQIQRLNEELPRAWESLEKHISRQPWGQQVERMLPDFKQVASEVPSALRRASGVLSSTLGVIANIVIIVFVGFYLAAEPARYVRGIVRLV